MSADGMRGALVMVRTRGSAATDPWAHQRAALTETGRRVETVEVEGRAMALDLVEAVRAIHAQRSVLLVGGESTGAALRAVEAHDELFTGLVLLRPGAGTDALRSPGELAAPVLVLAGEEDDAAVLEHYSELVKELRDADGVRLQHSGADPARQESAAVTVALLQWLDRHGL